MGDASEVVRRKDADGCRLLDSFIRKHPETLAVCAGLQGGVSGSRSFTLDDEGDAAAQLVITLCYCELCLKLKTCQEL